MVFFLCVPLRTLAAYFIDGHGIFSRQKELTAEYAKERRGKNMRCFFSAFLCVLCGERF